MPSPCWKVSLTILKNWGCMVGGGFCHRLRIGPRFWQKSAKGRWFGSALRRGSAAVCVGLRVFRFPDHRRRGVGLRHVYVADFGSQMGQELCALCARRTWASKNLSE